MSYRIQLLLVLTTRALRTWRRLHTCCSRYGPIVRPSDQLSVFTFSQSAPLPFRAMFQSYFELGNRIRKHYFSLSVVLCLASGQFVPPIHRRNLYSLQYSMLPANRASIGELWKKISERKEIQVHMPSRYASLPSRRGLVGINKRASK